MMQPKAPAWTRGTKSTQQQSLLYNSRKSKQLYNNNYQVPEPLSHRTGRINEAAQAHRRGGRCRKRRAPLCVPEAGQDVEQSGAWGGAAERGAGRRGGGRGGVAGGGASSGAAGEPGSPRLPAPASCPSVELGWLKAENPEFESGLARD